MSRYYTHPENPTGALICSFGQATISHNILWQFTPDIYEGGHTREVQITLKEAQATHSILADPKFTDINNSDFTLASDSPAINAGPPDPQYNDRDGSRNDIGMFGGTILFPMDGPPINRSCSVWMLPRLPSPWRHRHHRIHRSHREINFLIMKSSILTFFLSLILGTTLAHGAVIHGRTRAECTNRGGWSIPW